MRVRIKICGITNFKDAEGAVKMGADALGFVFYKKSPRKVSINTAKDIIRRIPPFVEKVGVFVNEKKQKVRAIIKKCSLSAVQFHGDETSEYCSSFNGIKVIKAIRVKDKKSLSKIKSFDKVDALLLDTFQRDKFGGTGRAFDWGVITKDIRTKLPVILSGGLNSDNVGSAIKRVRPYAVDVSSGIELKPGIKDIRLMRRFFKSACVK